MSNTNTADQVIIGGQSFTLAPIVIKRNIKTKVDEKGNAVDPNAPVPVVDGKPVVYKSKMLPQDYTIIGPLLQTAAEAADFIKATIIEAETREAGGGIALAKVYLEDRLEAASEHNFDLESGKADVTGWQKQITSAEAPRSAALSMDALTKGIAAIAPEMAQMAAHMGTSDGWKDYRGEDGNPVYATQDEFLLRFDAIQKRLNNYVKLIEQKNLAMAANKAKRDAKAEQARKAAAALAAGAPSPQPAH